MLFGLCKHSASEDIVSGRNFFRIDCVFTPLLFQKWDETLGQFLSGV